MQFWLLAFLLFTLNFLFKKKYYNLSQNKFKELEIKELFCFQFHFKLGQHLISTYFNGNQFGLSCNKFKKMLNAFLDPELLFHL